MLVLPQTCYVVEGDLGLVIYRHIRFWVMLGVAAQGFMLLRQVL